MRLKGKGHEVHLPMFLAQKSPKAHNSQWGDASRLLSFYQDWLDDLFPKAKFLDALGMVEKAGHNKQLQHHRVDWINEGRPKTSVVDEGGDAADDNDAAATTTGNSASTRIAPIFDKPAASGRPKTPDFDNLFGEEDDIYNATPVGARKNGPAAATGDEPDEDELDALMAMDAASGPTTSTTKPSAGAGAMKSLFGDGKPKAAAAPRVEPDDFDDWDAMLADAEEETPRPKEAPAAAVAVTVRQPARNRQGNEDDDLDALMAEAEAQFEPAKPVEAAAAAPTARTAAPGFDDEEEAMAEMDGLW